MLDVILSVLTDLGQSIGRQIPHLIMLGVAFTAISLWANRGRITTSWWKKPDLATDLCYALLMPVVGSYARISILVVGAGLITGSLAIESIGPYLKGGSGPLSGLPFWGQMVIYLIGTDLIMYASHRFFHKDALWRYHAIHHAPEHLDWTSTFRFHPVNIAFHSVLADSVLLLMGVAPDVLISLAAFQIFWSALVHADLNWTFGPFRYLIASPVFHRWHHTSPAEGGESNFAPTFPFIDLAFGTFYMPEGKIPVEFGCDDPNFPARFDQQMAYPFVKPKQATGPVAAE
jgi:sterol desaturase/sphingolipid hydroxylase (fatty acid hydroxylase superfamily)